MQTTDVVVHAWTVEEAPWTYEPSQKDAEAENDRFSLFNPLAACVLTVALNVVTAQLSREPANESCGKIYPYPMCDSWALKDSVRFPMLIGQPTWCEICLLLIAAMTCLHWSCVFSLFGQSRWKTQFLPQIIMATFITLLPLAAIIRDPTTIFLRLLPIVTDIYICVALILHYARGGKLRFKTFT
ncbi:hypothetical protein V8C42DRAFT_308127 [Trichoderma barbatum]